MSESSGKIGECKLIKGWRRKKKVIKISRKVVGTKQREKGRWIDK